MPGTNPLRCSHTAMVNNGSKILLLDTGNYPGQSNFLNETVTWASGNWTVVSTSQIDPLGPLPLRAFQGMGLDGYSTEVVLFGGKGESETAGVLYDTWTWTTGGVWAQQAPGTVPSGRYKHQMALLDGLGCLMFGGCNVQGLFEETWLWSGGTGGNWSLLTPAVTPPGRTDFAMAGNTGLTNVLMFGGAGTAASFNDTWMWVGSASGNWVKQSPAVTPPAMYGHCMAYDAANSEYVMFAGGDEEGLVGAQTWIWSGDNGGNWTLATPAVSPAARVGAVMAYDTTSSRVIMFGGFGTASNVFNETWTWTGGVGGNWVQL